jgi:hypothetical protein
MSRRQSMASVGVLVFALSVAWAQDTSTTPPNGGAPDAGAAPQQPAPAYGQDNAPPPMTENPPLSGLDQPGLEPHAAPLSYIQPGASVSESADSNVASELGNGDSVRSISRAIGSLTLQRLWKNYDLALQYMGGAAYYDEQGLGWKMLQQMDLDQKVTWKRGQFSVRDSFSYLPEGNFGSAYGSLGSQGIASLGNTAFGSFWSGASLGTLGLVPRIANVSLADVSENLTPKSAITVAGGYAFTHFYGTDPVTGVEYLDNSQTSAQVGYNRLLSAHTQVALVYGYQGFDFSSVGIDFHSHVIQLMYGHRISGRMDFLIGAGPQITLIGLACTGIDLLEGNPHCSTDASGNPVGTIPDTRIGVAGRVRLRYQFPRTSLDLTYERFETSGSGFFAGAETDLARLRAERPLSRVWNAFADIGYSRNSRAQPASEGVNANVYTLGFVGVGVHRAIGRSFHGFISYQLNELSFDKSLCGTASACNRNSNRQVGTIGLDWTPRPIRID